MARIYLVILGFVFSVSGWAQPFTAINNPFPGIARGAQAFADFDNDHDLDLIICGQDNAFLPVGKVFENNAATFTDAGANIKGLYNSAISIADYDHDGLMDFVITGQDLQGNETRLYRNIGNLQFQLTDTSLYAAGADGDVAFGDYDNDGYADIILSGSWNSKLYHNNGNGIFSEVAAELPGLNSPSVAWGDYDNDGDADLLMVGDDGSVSTYVMTNNDGTFSRLETTMEGAIGGSARWGDSDLDGYLDILITGKDWSLAPVSYIYHNNSDNTFTFASVGLVGTALGPADWIDYDNDGDLDIMLSGQNAGCGNSSTILYANDGIGGYSQFATLNFVERAASAWGDFDNDGDSDLLLTGISGTATRYFYKNDLMTSAFQQNTPPSIPEVTDIFTWEDYGIINWNRSNDLQSPELAITYNMRIGTTPGGIDILSPLSDIVTGIRYQPLTGNLGCNIFGVFKELQPATYYFSIQAIDQSYSASGFSEEQVFIILPTSLKNTKHSNTFVNVVNENGKLIINSNIEEGEVTLISLSGSIIGTSKLLAGSASIHDQGLAKGLYILQIKSGGSFFARKIYI